jgi:hypothetical protein
VEESGRDLIKVLSQHWPGVTEENHEPAVMKTGLRVEIWTWDLRNTKQEYSIVQYSIVDTKSVVIC